MQKNVIEINGKITEALPGYRFAVRLENDVVVTAHVSGKMRIHHIRIIPGDEVVVQFSPYDLKHGRIVFRGRRKRTKEIDNESQSIS